MAEFLTTKGMASALEDIIKEAKNKLVIVSPYLKVSPIFKRHLNDAAGRGVKIKMLYGKKELPDNEYSSLNKLEGIELIFVKELHAKCYLHETKAIIGSMNFYEFSEANNNEMGVLLTKQTDTIAFDKMVGEVASLIKNYRLPVETIKPVKIAKPIIITRGMPPTKAKKGFCIRCSNKVTFDSEHPLCDDCFHVWKQYGNTSYPENYCHGCQKPISTTYDHPQCYSCWSTNRVRF